MSSKSGLEPDEEMESEHGLNEGGTSEETQTRETEKWGEVTGMREKTDYKYTLHRKSCKRMESE